MISIFKGDYWFLKHREAMLCLKIFIFKEAENIHCFANESGFPLTFRFSSCHFYLREAEGAGIVLPKKITEC